ncbi:MAG: carboxymuconolactone decarboxylase family protein [Micromonosporaceae bacterium]|nr:carboxymuconolactone decarboxylase family protein [Micromonosporaceae bacterium]
MVKYTQSDAGGPAPVWRQSPVRVRALAPEALGRQVIERLEEYGYPVASANPLFRTLAVHEDAFSRWLPWHVQLVHGDLDERSRELVILRTAWRCRAQYVWDRHVVRAKAAGITDAEVTGILGGTGEAGWTPFDAALLKLVDELHDSGVVGDATWPRLAGLLDERQLVELVLLIGYYHMIAYFANATGVPLDQAG